MAVQELRTLDEVTDDTGIVGNGDTVCLFSSNGCSVGVGYGANTADALHNVSSIFRRAVLNYELHAAEAAAGNPSIGNNTVFNLHLYAEMTLNTGYGIDYGTCHRLLASLQNFFVVLANGLAGMLLIPLADSSKSAPPSVRPIFFMPKPWITSAAATTPVSVQAIASGWTTRPPMRRSRKRARKGVLVSTQFSPGSLGLAVQQPMQGPPEATHQERRWFQRTTPQLALV